MTANVQISVNSNSVDVIHEKASQLSALLATVTGDGFESFKECTDEVQQNILCLAQALAADIEANLHLVRRQ